MTGLRGFRWSDGGIGVVPSAGIIISHSWEDLYYVVRGDRVRYGYVIVISR